MKYNFGNLGFYFEMNNADYVAIDDEGKMQLFDMTEEALKQTPYIFMEVKAKKFTGKFFQIVLDKGFYPTPADVEKGKDLCINNIKKAMPDMKLIDESVIMPQNILSCLWSKPDGTLFAQYYMAQNGYLFCVAGDISKPHDLLDNLMASVCMSVKSDNQYAKPAESKEPSTINNLDEFDNLISEEEQRIKPKEINLQEEIKKYDFVMRIDGCYRITGIGVIIEGFVLKGQISTGENAYYIDNLGKKQIQIDKIEVFKRHPDGKAYEGEFITIAQNQLDRTEISKDGYIVGNSTPEKNPSIINSIRELDALNAKSKQEHAEKKKKRFLEEIKKYDFVMSLDDCGPIDGGIMFRGYILKGQISSGENVYYINDIWHKKQIHIDILEVFENDREPDGKAYKGEFVIIVDQNMVDYTDMGFGDGYYIVGNSSLNLNEKNISNAPSSDTSESFDEKQVEKLRQQIDSIPPLTQIQQETDNALQDLDTAISNLKKEIKPKQELKTKPNTAVETKDAGKVLEAQKPNLTQEEKFRNRLLERYEIVMTVEDFSIISEARAIIRGTVLKGKLNVKRSILFSEDGYSIIGPYIEEMKIIGQGPVNTAHEGETIEIKVYDSRIKALSKKGYLYNDYIQRRI